LFRYLWTSTMSAEKTQAESTEKAQAASTDDGGGDLQASISPPGVAAAETKNPWWNSVFVAGSVTQIIIAAVLAVSIGIAVSYSVETIPKAATVLVGIPGRLWLRALRAVGTFIRPRELESHPHPCVCVCVN